MASMALAIAVDDNRTSLRTASSLAMALKTALEWAGYRPSLIKAGERMLIYDDIKKEYNAALDEVLDLEEQLPWQAEGARCPGINGRAKLRLYTAEIALKMAAEEKACEEFGPHQAAMLKILDQINEIGPRIRIYPVCRARTVMSNPSSISTTCGISFPSCLWTKSADG